LPFVKKGQNSKLFDVGQAPASAPSSPQHSLNDQRQQSDGYSQDFVSIIQRKEYGSSQQ
jgi:hypothetical protein